MKKLTYYLCLIFAALCMITACSDDEEIVPMDGSPVAGKKVAYIINMAPSGIFQMCAERCQQVSETLGMTCDVFFEQGDDEKFKSRITSCAEQGYDGLYLSHGGKDYSYTFLTELLSQYPSLKIVTFDTVFENENGAVKKIKGVTQFFQDDADLAGKLLQYACTELKPDKSPVNVLKVWVGPNHLAAFDRREVGYQKYEQEGMIRTVEVIGPEGTSDVVNSMQTVMKNTLQKYSEKEIDVIWVAYDLYAQGCYPALKESGKRIPLVSVDICNQDIEYMKEKNSLWKACACTDFKANGEQGIRILALELAEDYGAITAPGSKVPTSYIEMPASLITQKHIFNGEKPVSYGNKSNFVTNSWLKKYLGY